MYDCDIQTTEDILNYISTTSIYCVERNGKYLNFPPVNILEYFTRDKLTGEYTENGEHILMEFQPQPDDIAYLRTFKFEDLTYRGTIEYRSACCQPIGDENCLTVMFLYITMATTPPSSENSLSVRNCRPLLTGTRCMTLYQRFSTSAARDYPREDGARKNIWNRFIRESITAPTPPRKCSAGCKTARAWKP